MIQLAWSFIERMLPRFASAIVVFALASILTPEILGMYAWVILTATFVQIIGEVTARQVAVAHLGTPNGDRFIRSFVIISSLAGGALTAGVIGILLLTQPPELAPQVLGCLPFVLVPTATALSMRPIVHLQAAGAWRAIATAQAVAVCVSLAISIPALLLTHSLLASALQVTATEVILAWWTWRTAKSTPAPDRRENTTTPAGILREYWHIALYSALGWGQVQTDRLGIGALAGPAALGQYSFAVTLSRSIADAASGATLNVLRPRLIAARLADSDARLAPILNHVLIRALMLVSITFAATVIATNLIIAPFFPPVWGPAIAIVPILALTGLPTVISWSMTMALQLEDRIRQANTIKAVGMLFGVAVAFAALVDLQLAAWLVLVREVVVMLLLLAAIRRSAPWRSAMLCLGLTLIGAVLILLSPLLG